MGIEEKAKAYDEAINQAKKELQTCGSLNCDAARQIFRLFPKLAESEDEGICRRCIDLLRKVSAYSGEEYLGVEIVDCIIGLQALIKKHKESLHTQETCKENANSFTDEDERIRKSIIQTLEFACAHKLVDYDAVVKMKAYLEKQKEQRLLSIGAASEWLRNHVCNYVNSEYNEFHKCVEYDGSIDKERLINDFEEAMQKESLRDFIDDFPYSCEQKEQKPAEWKPQSESLEALMYAIEGNWEMIKPTSYLSRRLEDLYEELINTYSIDETLLAELPKTAYTAKDIEELKVMKAKIDASMESPEDKPVERFEEAREKYQVEWSEEDGKIKKAISYAIAQSTHADNTIIDGITKDEALAYLYRQDSTKWSDEDEYALLQLMSIVQGYEKMQKNPGADCIMWSTDRQLPKKLFRFLKSLKPQAKQEWSEKDEENLLCVRGLLKHYLSANYKGSKYWDDAQVDELLEWTKNLPNRFQIQPKQEWSEENKMDIELLIALLRGKVNLVEILDSRKESIINFLKSLRPFWKPSEVCYGAKGDPDPAGVWKPSEEQMNALNALNCHGNLSYIGQQNQLISLYNDLKKLRGGVAPMREVGE